MSAFSKQRNQIQSLAGSFLLTLLCVSIATAQNVSEYFPSKLGNSWRYQRFDLDTLQNQIAGSKKIVVDSLAGTQQVKGLPASVLVNGNNPQLDSTIINVQGLTISHFVVGYPRITSLLPVDSLGLGFVWHYLNWYPYMKFGTPPAINTPDTLLRFDTSVVFKSAFLPLRIVVSTMRRVDTNITVPAGNFSTTPFVVALYVSTFRSIPPFGRVEIYLFKLTDTMFVAKNKWIVKEIQPSTFYPLNNDSSYNVAETKLPGFVRLLESASIMSVLTRETIPHKFSLEQNFPNPFNPATHLQFTIADLRFVTLKVFDVIGREVTALVDEELPTGTYDVTFDATNLSSGVYFYRLSAGDFVQTKKMILQK